MNLWHLLLPDPWTASTTQTPFHISCIHILSPVNTSHPFHSTTNPWILNPVPDPYAKYPSPLQRFCQPPHRTSSCTRPVNLWPLFTSVNATAAQQKTGTTVLIINRFEIHLICVVTSSFIWNCWPIQHSLAVPWITSSSRAPPLQELPTKWPVDNID